MTSREVFTSDPQPQPIYAGQRGWYNILEHLTTGSLTYAEAQSLAVQGRHEHNDACWALPVAMVCSWMESRYSDALETLLEPSVVKACDSLWIYRNLVGMSSRQIEGQQSQLHLLLSAQLVLTLIVQILSITTQICLKDDNPERAVGDFICVVCHLKPSAAAAWHSYGSTLSNLSKYKDALISLRLSLCLDPCVADVWCNLGLAYFGPESFVLCRTGISLCNLLGRKSCR